MDAAGRCRHAGGTRKAPATDDLAGRRRVLGLTVVESCCWWTWPTRAVVNASSPSLACRPVDGGGGLLCAPAARRWRQARQRGDQSCVMSLLQADTRSACLLTLLALGRHQRAIATAQTAQDFSVRATATVPAGTTIARVALPAATIAALRTPDGGDLQSSMLPGIASLCPDQCRDAKATNRPDAAASVYWHCRSRAGAATRPPLPATRRHCAHHRRTAATRHRILAADASWAAGDEASPAATEVRGWLFGTRSVDSELRAVELEATLPDRHHRQGAAVGQSGRSQKSVAQPGQPMCRCSSFRPLTPAQAPGR